MVSDTFHNVGVMIDPKRRKSSCCFPGAVARVHFTPPPPPPSAPPPNVCARKTTTGLFSLRVYHYSHIVKSVRNHFDFYI